MQFSAAYKKILIHNDIQDVLRGNCLPLESVPILKYSSNISHEWNSVEVRNASPPKNTVIEDFRLNEGDDNEEYTYSPKSYHLSLCSSSIVAYIAGFIVYKLKKSLRCEACLEGLSRNNNKAMKSLINVKSKGYLIHPSDDVIEICQRCELLFRKSISFHENSRHKSWQESHSKLCMA